MAGIPERVDMRALENGEREMIEIGKVINGQAERDAIHVALAPVVASAKLKAGQHVGLDAYGRATTFAKPIGIVDPFLTCDVALGQRFWLFLYQNSVTSLRHEWTHPAFVAKESEPSLAERNLRAFAEEVGMSYSALLCAARSYLETGDWHTIYGSDTPDIVYEKSDEFWVWYEAVTGKRVEEDKRGTFIGCSC